MKKSLKRRAPAPNTAANGREPSRVVVRKRAENEDDADGCDSASWADLSPGETDAEEPSPECRQALVVTLAATQRCCVVALGLAGEDCKRPAHANERLADTI